MVFNCSSFFYIVFNFRGDIDSWVSTTEMLLQRSKTASQWFIEYLSSEEGKTYIKYDNSLVIYKNNLIYKSYWNPGRKE